MSAKRTHPKESVTNRLSLQDDAFLLLRLTGMTERASVIAGNRVSIWFRLYSAIIAVLTLGFAATNLILVVVPNGSLYPMFSEDFSMPQRAVYAVWCTMCAILRTCVSCITLSKGFARDLERTTADIQCETNLAKFWVPSRLHLFVMNSASLSVLAFLVVVNFCMYARYSGLSFGELIAKPMSYLFLMECVVFGTSFLGPCVLLGTISRGNLTRMFCWIDSEVKEWSDGQQKSDETLKAMMDRHNLCWRLTDTYDKVFRAVLGTCFIFCVPIFCLVTTQVVKIYTERDEGEHKIHLVIYLLLWSVACIVFTSLMCSFAASVNSAAAAPRKHLMELTSGHSIRLLHFLGRLNEYKIGFTFFSFFVIDKTTILTIFSLMVSYLVVFLQMAQADSSSAQPTKAPQ